MQKLWTLMFFLALQCLCAQEWEPSFHSAITKASNLDRKVLLVFSGSDWCAPCIRLKKNILQTAAFQAYAEEHLVLYDADFPRKRKNQLPEKKALENAGLAEKFNPEGYFPYMVLLDESSQTLGVLGFESKKTTEDYITSLKALSE